MVKLLYSSYTKPVTFGYNYLQSIQRRINHYATPSLLVVIILVMYFFPGSAKAWGPKGHQIIAYIAEAHLTEATRQRIKAILPTNGTLAKASIWPDEIRKALPQLNPLHYVDVPRGESKYDRERDCPQRNCIVEAVTWYLTVLKSNDSPVAEKQIALDYLVHLVGDLHLPLHVGFLDDLGGTKTKVTFHGKTQTLHELWDSGMLETENGTARAMAKLLDEECDPGDRIAWQAGTPTDWANESLALTIEYVYPLPESHEISEEYLKRAIPILHQRLVQAGVRLAWLLNDALK
jgi:nuclease S1